MFRVRTEDETLTLWSKLAYAVGGLAHSVGPGTIVAFWYLFFLTDVAGLAPSLAGLTIIIGGVWDAVNDPLIGWLSDRTRTRWGRRRPYLLFGALPYGATFALMWWVPPIDGGILLSLYFAGVYILFDTAVTLVSCPYDALVPELTVDYDERTSVTSYRAFVSILTGLLAAVGFGILLDSVSSTRAAFLGMGVTLGVVFVPTILVAFFGTKERRAFQERPAAPFWKSIRFVAKNRPWRYSLGMTILSWVPVNIASAVFVYYLIYWIKMEPGEASIIQAVILASSALFMPLVLWIGRKWDKRTAYVAAIASWLMVMLSILLVPQEARILAYLVAVLAGPGIAAAHAIPRAISADTLDFDQLNSGLRQEGIYAGFEVFARKISVKVVLAAVGPVLGWSGYVQSAAVQPPTALWAIRLLVSVAPSVILALALILAWKYPLSREGHMEIQEQLRKRKLLSYPQMEGGKEE